MGSVLARFQEPLGAAADSVNILRGRKRRRNSDLDRSTEEITSDLESTLNTPKRKKLLSTPQYIYRTLFKEQHDSDVSVVALGKVWHLHKIYLCQSPYFASMFGGNWRETKQNYINIEIIDPRITNASLDAVFGSLYIDEVTLEPKSIISVLATATLFQLDGLTEKCSEVMVETTNAETVLEYYNAACQYGVKPAKDAAFNWLLVNLLGFYGKHSKFLRDIDVDLMSKLVQNPNLFVMQTEISLYTLLRVWMYCKQRNEFTDISSADQRESIKQFYRNRRDAAPFLETSHGEPFVVAFKALRLQHLLSHPVDLRQILDDKIIPQHWLNDHMLNQWKALLDVDQSIDSGPQDCDENEFNANCMRCGRILEVVEHQKWRWTGFYFGIDLVMTADGKNITIKRHHRTELERVLSLQAKRNFVIKVTVASLNDQRQIVRSQTTGKMCVSLDKNEEIVIMNLAKDIKYPLHVSVNLLVVLLDKKAAIAEPVKEESRPLPVSNIGSSQRRDSNEQALDGNTSGTS